MTHFRDIIDHLPEICIFSIGIISSICILTRGNINLFKYISNVPIINVSKKDEYKQVHFTPITNEVHSKYGCSGNYLTHYQTDYKWKYK